MQRCFGKRTDVCWPLSFPRHASVSQGRIRERERDRQTEKHRERNRYLSIFYHKPFPTPPLPQCFGQRDTPCNSLTDKITKHLTNKATDRRTVCCVVRRWRECRWWWWWAAPTRARRVSSRDYLTQIGYLTQVQLTDVPASPSTWPVTIGVYHFVAGRRGGGGLEAGRQTERGRGGGRNE